MAIWYMDVISGNNANAGTSPAAPLQNFNGLTAAKGVVAGDEVRIKESPTTITSIGSCTWTQYSNSITIPAGIIKNVDMCETAWTGSANVTSAVTTNAMQGTNRLNISIAAGFTTGKIAYKTLAVTEDFSAYQQLSFFVESSATVANCFYLALCSDTTGDVVVNTIPFNTYLGTTANLLIAHTIDNGSALGSAIQSVALYATSDPGTCTINLDNIIACKAPASADALSLQDLVGLNQGSMPEWFHIKSINGTTMEIGTNGQWSGGRTNPAIHFASSGSFTTYRLNGYIPVTGNAFLGSYTINNLTISGGWDSATMSVQSGHTWFSRNICFQAADNGFTMGTVTGPCQLKNIGLWNVAGFAANAGGDQSQNVHFENVYMLNSWTSVTFRNQFGSAENCIFHHSAGLGDGNFQFKKSFKNCIFRTGFQGTSSALSGIGSTTAEDHFIDCTFYSCIPVARGLAFNSTMEFYSGVNMFAFAGQVISHLNGCTVKINGVNYTYSPNLTIRGPVRTVTAFNKDITKNYYISPTLWAESVTDSNRRTASGLAWKLTGGQGTPKYFGLFPLAAVYCKANTPVTVKVWIKRNTSTALWCLYVPPQFGITTEQESTPGTAAINTYEQLSLTVTPTQNGVIEFFVKGNGTFAAFNYGIAYIDDIEIS